MIQELIRPPVLTNNFFIHSAEHQYQKITLLSQATGFISYLHRIARAVAMTVLVVFASIESFLRFVFQAPFDKNRSYKDYFGDLVYVVKASLALPFAILGMGLHLVAIKPETPLSSASSSKWEKWAKTLDMNKAQLERLPQKDKQFLTALFSEDHKEYLENICRLGGKIGEEILALDETKRERLLAKSLPLHVLIKLYHAGNSLNDILALSPNHLVFYQNEAYCNKMIAILEKGIDLNQVDDSLILTVILHQFIEEHHQGRREASSSRKVITLLDGLHIQGALNTSIDPSSEKFIEDKERIKRVAQMLSDKLDVALPQLALDLDSSLSLPRKDNNHSLHLFIQRTLMDHFQNEDDAATPLEAPVTE